MTTRGRPKGCTLFTTTIFLPPVLSTFCFSIFPSTFSLPTLLPSRNLPPFVPVGAPGPVRMRSGRLCPVPQFRVVSLPPLIHILLRRPHVGPKLRPAPSPRGPRPRRTPEATCPVTPCGYFRRQSFPEGRRGGV